jgi:hypothetical protein
MFRCGVAAGDDRNRLQELRGYSCFDASLRSEELEMPTLRPPSGMTGGSTGMSGSGDSRETSVHLRGGQSPAELLDHFAPQLKEQGWTLSNRVTEGDAGMLSARKTNSRGETVYLLVTDVRYMPREHDATLRVWRQSDNR